MGRGRSKLEVLLTPRKKRYILAKKGRNKGKKVSPSQQRRINQANGRSTASYDEDGTRTVRVKKKNKTNEKYTNKKVETRNAGNGTSTNKGMGRATGRGSRPASKLPENSKRNQGRVRTQKPTKTIRRTKTRYATIKPSNRTTTSGRKGKRTEKYA